DNIYANLDKITNKRHRTALENGRDFAQLSRELVRLKTDVELGFDLDDLVVDPSQIGANEALLRFYEEMEFRGLQARVRERLGAVGLDMPSMPEERASVPAQPAAPQVQDYSDIARHVDYRRIETRTDLTRLLDMLSNAPFFALDTETTGLDVHSDEL